MAVMVQADAKHCQSLPCSCEKISAAVHSCKLSYGAVSVAVLLALMQA